MVQRPADDPAAGRAGLELGGDQAVLAGAVQAQRVQTRRGAGDDDAAVRAGGAGRLVDPFPQPTTRVHTPSTPIALAEAGIRCWADKGYRGAGGTVRIPCWGRWETLSACRKAVKRSHAKIRALVEQAVATLKSWRLVRKQRCSTNWITSFVQAVLTLHLTSS